MSETSNLPSYTEFAELLQKIQPNCNAAQIHGLLCGFICGTTGENQPDLWQEVFPHTKRSKPGETVLKELYEATYHQLSEFSFEFSLLLPDDEADINMRAEALGLWCQGFLTGLELSKFSIAHPPEGELKEAIDDIVEIAKITFGDIATNDEDETAYFELVEYVRLTALMIFHELKTDKSTPTSDDMLLH